MPEDIYYISKSKVSESIVKDSGELTVNYRVKRSSKWSSNCRDGKYLESIIAFGLVKEIWLGGIPIYVVYPTNIKLADIRIK